MNKKNSDGQVRIIIRFNGKLDEERLGRAVRLAFDAEPVIGCRFIEKMIRPYWQRCTELENAFHFRTIDTADQDKIIYDYLLAPLDPFKGPQVNVGLYRSELDTLYIKMSHIVADGGASIEYLQLLSNIYNTLKQNPEYSPVCNLHGDRSSKQALKHVGLMKILASCRHISLAKPTWEFSKVEGGEAKSSFIVKRISSDRLVRIKTYAKAHGVTMGDILIAAYYRALFEVIDPPENVPLPILVPVNLRKYIPGGRGEGICSLTAGYFPKIIRRKAESFEETLTKVHDVMESNKSKQEELGQLFLMELAFAPGNIVPRILGSFLTSLLVFPTFSNIGLVDTNIVDFGGVTIREILPAGPMLSPPNFVMGANTSGGEMALTTIIYGSEAFRTRVISFFDVLVRELPEYG